MPKASHRVNEFEKPAAPPRTLQSETLTTEKLNKKHAMTLQAYLLAPTAKPRSSPNQPSQQPREVGSSRFEELPILRQSVSAPQSRHTCCRSALAFCLACCAARRCCNFSFCLLFLSPGSHKWQKVQARPFSQPLV